MCSSHNPPPPPPHTHRHANNHALIHTDLFLKTNSIPLHYACTTRRKKNKRKYFVQKKGYSPSRQTSSQSVIPSQPALSLKQVVSSQPALSSEHVVPSQPAIFSHSSLPALSYEHVIPSQPAISICDRPCSSSASHTSQTNLAFCRIQHAVCLWRM